jgi:beta-lactamase regulating signal transducer with metallopeptidase domain
METLLLECAVRAILIATGTAAVLSVMRVRSVVVRHHAWTGVMLFMLMLPLWTAFGYQVPIRVLSAIDQQSELIRPISVEKIPIVMTRTSDLSSAVSKRDVRPQAVNWGRFVLGVYFLGASVLLLRLAIGTIGVYFLIRQARREQGRLTSSLCVSPITVGWLPAVTILPDGWTEWSQAKLDAVLTHENEHARRHDPSCQWLALLNRAVFWFHPLAWWLERKLAALSEEACDTAVLERGHQPREYSEYLLDLAASVMGARKRLRILGMAMPGYFLPQRIQKILRGVEPTQISHSRMALTILVCTVFSVVLATGTLAHARLAPVSLAGQISTRSKATGTRDPLLSEFKEGAVTKEAITWQAGVTVTRVQIAGNRRIPTDTIRSGLQTKAGDPISLTAISRDIRALYSLGFFDDVQFETESADSGMIVTFSVKEKPLIRAIEYKGAQSVTIAEIREEIRNAHTGLTPDSPYSLDRATAAAKVLKSMLVAKGYAQATVGIATERVPPNAVNVIFVVDEGTR